MDGLGTNGTTHIALSGLFFEWQRKTVHRRAFSKHLTKKCQQLLLSEIKSDPFSVWTFFFSIEANLLNIFISCLTFCEEGRTSLIRWIFWLVWNYANWLIAKYAHISRNQRLHFFP